MFGFKKTDHPVVTALIMAAGSGSRMNSDTNKQFIYLLDKPLIAHTLSAFEAAVSIDKIVVVARQSELIAIKDIGEEFGISKLFSIVVGGDTRQQSVMLGLDEITDSDYVAIHDGARPCITPEIINNTVKEAITHGAAAIGCRVSDTLKRVSDGNIVDNVDRSDLWHIQTPQVFKTEVIKDAHRLATERGTIVTDDTELLRTMGIHVRMVEGDSTNIKVTTASDICIAEGILNEYENR